MIEILFIYMLGKRMGDMLRRKGYEKPLKYQLLVPIWWFTGEFAGAFLYMFVRAIATGAKELTWNIAVYPVALIGALLAVTVLLLVVRKAPVLHPGEPIAPDAQ
jgi:hypothetical protein